MQRLGREAYLVIFIVFLLLLLGGIGLRAQSNRRGAEEYHADASFAAGRYPYSQLSAQEQRLYDALYAGMAAHQDTVQLPGEFSADEYKRVYLTVRMQEPELFYVEHVYELAERMTEANIIYNMNEASAEAMRKRLDAAADSILSRLSPALSDWEKLLQIHDAIAAGCRYGAGTHSDDACGSLVEGVAMCEGYAQGFLYTARRAGLEVMCVPGRSGNGTEHVWNIANIGGSYYHIDLTWDDDDHYGGRASHTCFAQPDARFTDHLPDKTLLIPPACSSAEETFYQRRGFVLSEPAQLGTSLERWMQQQGAAFTEFCCRDGETADAIRQPLNAMLAGTGYRAYWDEIRQAVVITAA